MANLDWCADLCLKHGFELKDFIGAGGHSKVFTAIRRSDRSKVCIKMPNDPSRRTIEQYQQEVNILRRLKHDNIIELYSDFILADGVPCLALELSNIGDLSMYQANQPEQRIYAAERQSITLQLLAVLQYIHGRHIIHGDINPENVLVFDGMRVKLCDFKRSREFIPGKCEREILGGTEGFIAPEVRRGDMYLPEPIDMYALGMLHYVMACKDLPEVDPADDFGVFYERLLDIEDCNSDERLFILRLTLPNPGSRLDPSLALEEPYVQRTYSSANTLLKL